MRVWTKELKSGNREQAVGNQKTPNGYCCMGLRNELEGMEFREVEGMYALEDADGAVEMPRPKRLRSWHLYRQVTNAEINKIRALMEQHTIEYDVFENPYANGAVDDFDDYIDNIRTHHFSNPKRSEVLAYLNDGPEGMGGWTFNFIGTVVDELGWDNSRESD